MGFPRVLSFRKSSRSTDGRVEGNNQNKSSSSKTNHKKKKPAETTTTKLKKRSSRFRRGDVAEEDAATATTSPPNLATTKMTATQSTAAAASTTTSKSVASAPTVTATVPSSSSSVQSSSASLDRRTWASAALPLVRKSSRVGRRQPRGRPESPPGHYQRLSSFRSRSTSTTSNGGADEIEEQVLWHHGKNDKLDSDGDDDDDDDTHNNLNNTTISSAGSWMQQNQETADDTLSHPQQQQQQFLPLDVLSEFETETQEPEHAIVDAPEERAAGASNKPGSAPTGTPPRSPPKSCLAVKGTPPGHPTTTNNNHNTTTFAAWTTTPTTATTRSTTTASVSRTHSTPNTAHHARSSSDQSSSILFPELVQEEGDDDDDLDDEALADLLGSPGPTAVTTTAAAATTTTSTPPSMEPSHNDNHHQAVNTSSSSSSLPPRASATTQEAPALQDQSLEDYLQLQPSPSNAGESFSQTVVAGNVIMTSSSLLLSSVVHLSVLKSAAATTTTNNNNATKDEVGAGALSPPHAMVSTHSTATTAVATSRSSQPAPTTMDAQKFLFAPPAAQTVRASLQRHWEFHLSRAATSTTATTTTPGDHSPDPIRLAHATPLPDETADFSNDNDIPSPSPHLTPSTVHSVAQECLQSHNVSAALAVYQAYLAKQQQAPASESEDVHGASSTATPPLPSSLIVPPPPTPSSASQQFYRSPVSSFSTLEATTVQSSSHLSQTGHDEAGAQRADTLGKLAILYLYTGQHKAALSYALQAASLWKQASLNRPLNTAMAVMLVGLIQFAMSRAGRALKAWREAMQLICVSSGYDHPFVAVLLNNIGVLHYDSGDSMAALRAFEESLSLQRSMLKLCVTAAHVDNALFQMATTMGNLALALEMNERYDRAIALLQESQALFESIDETNATTTTSATTTTTTQFVSSSASVDRQWTTSNKDIAAVSSELVQTNLDRLLLRRETFLDKGRNDSSLLQPEEESMSLTDGSTVTEGDPPRSSTATARSTKGPGSLPSTLADNHDYLLLGLVAKELTPRQRVREIILTWFDRPPSSPEAGWESWGDLPLTSSIVSSAATAEAILPFAPLSDMPILSKQSQTNGLGCIESKPSVDRSSTVGQPTSPEKHHQSVVEEKKVDLDMDLRETHLVAMEHMDNGAIGDALDLFMEALKVLRARYGEKHHLVGSATHNVGMVHLYAEEYLQAYGIFKEAARIRSEALGSEHPDVAASVIKIGLLQYAAMDTAAAIRTFSEVRESYLKSVGYGHPHLAKIMNNIGVLRYEEGDFAGATRAFEIAYEYQRRLVEDCPGDSSLAEIAMGYTLANIGFLYHRQDELVSAVRLFEESRATLMRHLFADDPKVMMVQENIEYLVGRGVDMQAPCEEGCQLTPAAKSCLTEFSWLLRPMRNKNRK